MATYKEIQTYVRENHSITIKTCWIADMKEKCGLPKKIAPNRISKDSKVYPCPVDKEEIIKEAFKHFEMIN